MNRGGSVATFRDAYQGAAADGRNSSEHQPNIALLGLLARFGECQVMTHPVAKRLFISSLISKSFRGYYLLPAHRGRYAFATLNHQM